MPTYFYTARDSAGRLVKGSLSASSREELNEKLSAMGYFLTHVSLKEKRWRTSSISSAIKANDLIVFTIHLHTLLEAGVPLLSGLKGLARQAQGRRLGEIIEGICQRLEAGESFSQALAAYPKVFSKLYIGIVRAGESSGKLDLVLNWLAKFLQWQKDLRSQIRDVFFYPCILIGLMLLLVSLLVTFVLPRFVALFSAMRITLPLFTRILLSLSQFAHSHWLYFLLVFFIAGIAGFLYMRSEKGRYRVDYLKIRLPVIGFLIHKIALSRFAHTLSILLNSGVDILTSLEINKEVVNNAYLAKVIEEVKQKVKTGESLSQALKENKNFPPLVVTMIAVGENSGFLEKNLERVCQFYDEEVPRAIKRIFTFIEPLLILCIGLIVGAIALSIFLPLYQLITMVS
ncbi:MAG: hypothetical protein DRP75_01060 [Candidatus Omnitrophota bacterium]|nr:MAG: hypothetical protein DRP75_01060 [Candidatus Omnitrophota bacterium]